VILALATSFLAMMLTACVADTPVPPKNDMVGTWVHSGDGGKMILFASGKASFVSIPRDLLIGNRPTSDTEHKGSWTNLLTTDGRWQAPENVGDAYPSILGNIGNVGYKMSIEGDSNSSLRIVLPYGDDLEFEYTLRRVG
jgi:hypothetical protein